MKLAKLHNHLRTPENKMIQISQSFHRHIEHCPSVKLFYFMALAFETWL